MSYNLNLTAFSHGQIQSKLWLCEEIEKYITTSCNVAILGCWYNVLGFMMVTRNKNLYNYIHGIDINPEAVLTANKICDAWMVNDDQKIKNKCYNVNDIKLNNYDLIINTSCEDISSNLWYQNIEENKVVCLQTNNLTAQQVTNYSDWNILNPNPTMEVFINKYPMKKILFQGRKNFYYGTLNYSRYMLIGIK